jgi:hypothetical protein
VQPVALDFHDEAAAAARTSRAKALRVFAPHELVAALDDNDDDDAAGATGLPPHGSSSGGGGPDEDGSTRDSLDSAIAIGDGWYRGWDSNYNHEYFFHPATGVSQWTSPAVGENLRTSAAPPDRAEQPMDRVQGLPKGLLMDNGRELRTLEEVIVWAGADARRPELEPSGRDSPPSDTRDDLEELMEAERQLVELQAQVAALRSRVNRKRQQEDSPPPPPPAPTSQSTQPSPGNSAGVAQSWQQGFISVEGVRRSGKVPIVRPPPYLLSV